MQGLITGKHVIWYSGTIIREFGLRCWLRCLAALLAPRPTTFLAVACAVPVRVRREGAAAAPRARRVQGAPGATCSV